MLDFNNDINITAFYEENETNNYIRYAYNKYGCRDINEIVS